MFNDNEEVGAFVRENHAPILKALLAAHDDASMAIAVSLMKKLGITIEVLQAERARRKAWS